MSTEKTSGGYKDKMFSPKFLDVEQIILNLVNEAGLSALRVQNVGDMKQANAVFNALVLNLDAFVRPMLESDDSKNWSEYEQKRTEIIKKYPVGGVDPPVAVPRALYSLTVEVLAKERLFKARRYTYFGERWKKAQRPDLTKMQKEEEKDGVESDEA